MNQNRYLTIEESLSIPKLSHISISNDGEKLLLIKNTTNWKDNKYQNELWMYDKHRDELLPLLNKNIEASLPRWSPDSQSLSYLAKVGEKGKEKNQVFLFQINEYVSKQITFREQGVSSFKWSADNKGIFFLADNPESEEIKKRKDVYGDFTHVDKEHTFNSIYYLTLDKECKINEPPKEVLIQLRKDEKANTSENDKSDDKAEKIIGGNYYIRSFDISPLGNKLAFTSTPTPSVGDYLKISLSLFDLGKKEVTPFNVDAILFSSVLFSPDGQEICYKRSRREAKYYSDKIDDSILTIYNFSTNEHRQPLKDQDLDVYPLKWVDTGLLLLWQSKTNMLAGIMSSKGKLVKYIDKDDTYIRSISVTQNGKNFACIKADSQQLFEAYLNGKLLTAESNILADKKICQKRTVTWVNSDGLKIEGVLTLPCDFDTTKKYPLLLCIHGGPAWASFRLQANNSYYPIDQFVEKGFVIMEPNYRGSTGYGEEFMISNYRKLGTGDYNDIITGVDYLIDQGFIDEDNVGIMGWSQGGYISAYSSTFSNRFKAISVGAGISDWKTYYIETDIPVFTKSYLGNDSWSDREIYQKSAPMTYIKSACTPTLIQHGDADKRVPVSNAYELYRGLKDMKVETELIIFEGMGHTAHKPGLNRAIMKQNLAWFCHYILNDDLDNFRIM